MRSFALWLTFEALVVWVLWGLTIAVLWLLGKTFRVGLLTRPARSWALVTETVVQAVEGVGLLRWWAALIGLLIFGGAVVAVIAGFQAIL